MTENETSILEFVNNDLKDFSLYTLHSRAIPSMIDSFKPSQRKIIYTANKRAKNNFMKTASLAGAVIDVANFHHGDASLAEAISNMAANYSDNINFLVGRGSFGSRLVQEYSSPRYTFVKLSPDFDRIYQDSEILPENDDPEDPEPKHYLPVIPTVLVNGASGIATGFATNIIPRSREEIKDACKKYIQGKKIPNDLTPEFPEFTGTIFKNSNDEWVCRGKFSWLTNNKIEITEVPIGFDREKYIEHLEKLNEKDNIQDYDDKCADGFHFEVKLKNKHNYTDETIIKDFKLEKKLNENITVIDQNENLRIFDNEMDLLKEFCDYRLSKYEERYQYYIERDNENSLFAEAKKRMIEKVNNNEVDMKNTKKNELKQFLIDHILPSEISTDYYVERLLNIPIHHFTEDMLNKIIEEKYELENKIEAWKNKDRAQAFIDDLEKV